MDNINRTRSTIVRAGTGVRDGCGYLFTLVGLAILIFVMAIVGCFGPEAADRTVRLLGG